LKPVPEWREHLRTRYVEAVDDSAIIHIRCCTTHLVGKHHNRKATGWCASDCPEEDPVKDAQGNLVLGRTRWRRFAAVMVPAVAVASLLMVGVANGAFPASFAVSGSTFKVSADVLDGDGFVQYGGFASQKGATFQPNGFPADTKSAPIAISGIKDAYLTKLCQSVLIPGTKISLVIHAGDPATGAAKVHATDLIIGMSSLSGNATFTNIVIGQDASTLTGGPSGAVGLPGFFGQQADHVHIEGVKQVAWSTSAGMFQLNGLDLHVSTSGEECFPDA
jgi:hypothetical protein